MKSEFTVFRLLPTEIRLKIWRLTLPFRVVDAKLDKPKTGQRDERGFRIVVINNLSPIRPPLPVAFHICRESRNEALSIYRPCAGATWRSPHAYPHNLWNPERDVLFIAMDFPSSMTFWPFPTPAPPSHSLSRGFVLDQLAAKSPSDVAAIQRLAICWVDLHLQDASALALTLEPFRELKELSIVFYDVTGPRKDSRGCPAEESCWSTKLVKFEDSTIRGTFIKRKLSEVVNLAKEFNERFRDMEQEGEVERKSRKWPEVNIKTVVFGA
jgi:2EXR family